MWRSSRSGCNEGFTLVELLVVAAVVALLLGLLFPAVHSARSVAQSSACQSTLRHYVAKVQLYSLEYSDFLPGPDTSGRLYDSDAHNTFSHWYRRDGGARRPLTNMDWITPIFGDEMHVEGFDFRDRYERLYRSHFACPSNPLTYDFVYPHQDDRWFGLSIDDWPYFSYASPLGFHYDVGGHGPVAVTEGAHEVRGLPAGYRPKTTRVQAPSRKALVIEGTRFVTRRGLSFNDLPWQYQGGNFMLNGPYAPREGDPYIFDPASGEPNELSRSTSYRHADGSMNIAFFDGHVQLHSARASREPSLYLPSGTRLQDYRVD